MDVNNIVFNNTNDICTDIIENNTHIKIKQRTNKKYITIIENMKEEIRPNFTKFSKKNFKWTSNLGQTGEKQ